LPLVVGGLAVVLLGVCTAALCLGRYPLAPGDTVRLVAALVLPVDVSDLSATQADVVYRLRLPRIAAAALVGCALALAGAAYQGVFKNPLVSPGMLGVADGACAGAAIAIVCGLGIAWQQGLAFLGGVLTVLAAVLVARCMGGRGVLTLVLAGVIVGGFMGSVVGFLKYVADTETELPDIVYWQLGSLAKVTPATLAAVAPGLVAGIAVLLVLAWRVNVFSLDEEDVRTLGVNVRLERGVIVAAATLATACSVCVCGTIGWVGLVMPHMARSLVGANNARCMPVAGLLSAIFLVAVDTVSRTLTGAEVPLGILTGLVGAPVFAWILVRERGGRRG
jgi:iron complex transport system permease protein